MNRVEFDLEIYDKSIVLQAVEEYKGLCNIAVNAVDGHIVCEFSDCKYGLAATINEFSNYIIDLMNVNSYADY